MLALEIKTEYEFLQLVAVIANLSVLVSAIESIYLSKHFREDGLFSWKIQRTRDRGLLLSKLLPVFDSLFGFPNVLILIGLQILASVSLWAAYRDRMVLAAACGLIAITSIALSIRGNDGRTGADQMNKMTFLALFVAFLSSNPVVWRATLFFLSAQLVLAYATSGYLRIAEPSWRNGDALLLVLRQETYGNRLCWQFARRSPKLLRIATWSVLIFECSAPLAIMFPGKALLIFLAFGVLFHLANAMAMGLNTFVGAYIAPYPALFWTAGVIQRTMHRGRI